jgi:hypothetical protein
MALSFGLDRAIAARLLFYAAGRIATVVRAVRVAVGRHYISFALKSSMYTSSRALRIP